MSTTQAKEPRTFLIPGQIRSVIIENKEAIDALPAGKYYVITNVGRYSVTIGVAREGFPLRVNDNFQNQDDILVEGEKYVVFLEKHFWLKHVE